MTGEHCRFPKSQPRRDGTPAAPPSRKNAPAHQARERRAPHPNPETATAPRARRGASTLWLVRHGESGWNVAGRIQGQSPAAPGLTATGREQASHAALELARRAPRIPLIVASDLTRTTETSEINR